jgi:N utilization substance protein B
VRRTEQRRAAAIALYQEDVTGRPLEQLVPRRASSFTRELIEGVDRERVEIDGLIERHAEGWTLARMAPLDRNILRVALFEMLFRDDVPDEVAMDEAIEAAKEWCAAEAPGFLNGILAAVQRERVLAP